MLRKISEIAPCLSLELDLKLNRVGCWSDLLRVNKELPQASGCVYLNNVDFPPMSIFSREVFWMNMSEVATPNCPPEHRGWCYAKAHVHMLDGDKTLNHPLNSHISSQRPRWGITTECDQGNHKHGLMSPWLRPQELTPRQVWVCQSLKVRAVIRSWSSTKRVFVVILVVIEDWLIDWLSLLEDIFPLVL